MTEKVLDKCPKCSSSITNQVECENCGIVFEKYLQAEARRKTRTDQATMETAEAGSPRMPLLVGVVLISALAAAGYFGVRSCSSPDRAVADRPVVAVSSQDAGEGPAQSFPAMKTEPIDKKLLEGEPIQRALRATVSVHTSWGNIGSGFFIGEHEVVTNKHVVTYDDDKFEAMKGKVERNRKIIDLEVVKINDWKKKVTQMPAGPSRSQLELMIQDHEAEVSKYLSMQREEEERFAKLKAQRDSRDIKIVMDDNKEYAVDTVILSDNHDLALLKVYTVSGQVLNPRAKERGLNQGQVVYAIGSPMGLSNTVTSGIFSSYRKKTDSGEIYLQTDAAINPGNSGGPLIDSLGNVLGVNTMMISNAEGIGFAIPIDVVLEDFSGSF